MPDPRLTEQIDEPGLVEKEWHVVRAIGVLATIDHGNTRAAFSGGTSLSVAWGLIKRFSEDIDFKIAPALEGTSASQARAQCRTYRERVLAAPLLPPARRLIGEPGECACLARMHARTRCRRRRSLRSSAICTTWRRWNGWRRVHRHFPACCARPWEPIRTGAAARLLQTQRTGSPACLSCWQEMRCLGRRVRQIRA